MNRAPDGGTDSLAPDLEGQICEYGESQIAREHPQIPDSMGDWRPPAWVAKMLRRCLMKKTRSHNLPGRNAWSLNSRRMIPRNRRRNYTCQ